MSELLLNDEKLTTADIAHPERSANVQPAVIDKFFELACQHGRRFKIFPLFIRQTGVGVAGNVLPGELTERADVIGHELRTGGAVHAKGERLGMAQRSPHGFHGLSGKHGAHRLDRP